MKKSLQCPKCEGRKIWHIAELSVKHMQQPKPEAVPVVLKPRKMLGLPTAPTPVGGFEVFICKACGLSELYAKGIDDLEELPGLVTLLDNEPKATLR